MPEAIFNYVLTVEEYVFALSVCFGGQRRIFCKIESTVLGVINHNWYSYSESMFSSIHSFSIVITGLLLKKEPGKL